MESKAALRKCYKKKRLGLGEEKRARLSVAISKRSILFLNQHPEFRNIHIFLPIPRLHEVDTVPLLQWLHENGRQVFTSVVQWELEEMKSVSISPGEIFVKDNFGIMVPETPLFDDDQEMDLVFVPLLVADKKGNRLGYGKGYYDKFLSRLNPGVFKMGLSMFALAEQVPTSSYDVPLDGCIFPNECIVFNK